MNPLSTEHRRQLERTVIEARDITEAGARSALEALAVHHHEPYGHMSGEQRKLRNRLRAHARHLGDRVDARSGTHTIDHLVQECAYEHWHGMLFARFLAENQLLIEPEMGVAITLDECEELAREEGIDKWALAARYAHRMLPQVFRPDHPVFEIQFAREYRLKLEELLEGLPSDVFTATDALGWVYQFWQTRKKDQINRAEVKIGADELPAVTQLFTEPYMVQFLLHNSLGAWWVSRHPDKPCPVDLTYLRRKEEVSGVRSQVSGKEGASGVGCQVSGKGGATGGHRTPETGHPEPAAGRFDGWPDDLSAFRLLDPCCGSGHFLVAAFLMLVPMRMALEGLGTAEAVDVVLRENIHGLELDQRCVAIAAFALALEAWRYPDAGGYRSLPKLNLAWCGQPVMSMDGGYAASAGRAGAAAGKREHWLALAEGDSHLEAGMAALYETFRDAPILGSLIDPSRSVSEDLLTAGFEELQPLLDKALREHTGDAEWEETAIAALGLADAARLLSGHYHLVITNVPYLARGKQNERLRRFAETHYPRAKNDLANVFLERGLELSLPEGAGVTQIVMPQNWLFLTSYRKQREHLLKEVRWELLVRLGEGGFDSSQAAGAFTILLTLTRARPDDDHLLHGIDASAPRTAAGKAELLRDGELVAVSQKGQLENPDARVAFEEITGDLLENQAASFQGIKTGDDSAKRRVFWEQPLAGRWIPLLSTVEETTTYGGMQSVVDWQHEGKDMARLQGVGGWGNPGVVVSQMRGLPVALFSGERFDSNVSALPVKKPSNLPAIWCFCSSPEYNKAVRRIDQKLNVTNATLVKVPFDLAHWTKVAEERYPNGLPKPYSNDPTQWIFHGHPCGSVVWDEQKKWTAHGPLRTDATVLQVAVARLPGYRWPAELDAEMELADEQREWIEKVKALYLFEDEDGIVCIPPVRGERPAAERLLELLHAAYGDGWNEGILTRLLAEVGSDSLDDWLRNRFFEQHCKLFKHRPFIWHIWDGRKRDGFHALVNYHRLAEGEGKGRRLLESLTYSYLGDWIARQQDGVKRGEAGAEDRLAAALELQKRLVAILEGEPPFDIFVRWKPIEEQPIGWEPDINDGVRLNIRPFMAQDIPGGKKGAGILRARPNIHWKKDRGREPTRDQEQFPWFWKDGKFTGERVNDVHLSNAEKQKARERAEGRS